MVRRPHRPASGRFVDLVTAGTLRAVALPALGYPIGAVNGDPVIVDPARRALVVRPDGGLTPAGPVGLDAEPPGGRRVTVECDAPLRSCTQTFVDVDGTRTPLLDATRATTTRAVPAPAGARLVALYPSTFCAETGCRVGATGDASTGPLEVVDLDTGTPPVPIGTTSAHSTGTGGTGVGSVQWSTDGRWLFAAGIDAVQAWRPGLPELVSLKVSNAFRADLFGASFGKSVIFPTPAH